MRKIFLMCIGLLLLLQNKGWSAAYVTDISSGEIIAIEDNGNQTMFATGFNHPLSLSFDSQGNLFVLELSNGRVIKIDQTGTATIFTDKIPTQGSFSDITVTSDGRVLLLVAGTDPLYENSRAEIWQLLEGQNPALVIAAQNTNPSFNESGRGFIQGKDGYMYVAMQGGDGGRIMRASLDGDISYIDFGLKPFNQGGGDMIDVRFNSLGEMFILGNIPHPTITNARTIWKVGNGVLTTFVPPELLHHNGLQLAMGENDFLYLGGGVSEYGFVVRVDSLGNAETLATFYNPNYRPIFDIGVSSYQYNLNQPIDVSNVSYPPKIPEAAFKAFPTSGMAPLNVNFTNESAGTVTSWQWDFEDGSISDQQNPTYTYNYPGTYTVSLTAIGPIGSDTETKTNYITVVSPDAPDLRGRLKAFHLYEFGVSIGLTIQTENTGNQKANRFKVAFHFSNDGITLGELLDKETVMGGLMAGYVKDVTFKYESANPLSGRYIIVLIDSDDQVLETDETNNMVTIRIP
jgi:PKD repeat protein